MYSACLFCHAALGRNEVVEPFPVGRRLAFDAARGRLWVVCRACERWNLTPLEERWEAVEECERLYGATRLRTATSNIGLARLRDGTELVRIGTPLRPEFAAWRYGDQFGRRRRRQIVRTGGLLVAVGGAVALGAAAGVGVVALWSIGEKLGRLAVNGRPGATIARLTRDDGPLVLVRRSDLGRSTIVRDSSGELGLEVDHVGGRALFTGQSATRALATLLPAAGQYGGTPDDVASAVARIEHAGTPDRYVASMVARAGIARRPRRHPPWWGPDAGDDEAPAGILAIPTSVRLALEMALHEEQERRALEGELAELERAWRDAEEVAAIADDMFLPNAVTERFAAMVKGRGG